MRHLPALVLVVLQTASAWAGSTSGTMPLEHPVADFREGIRRDWYTIDDRVMGGVSRSRFEVLDSGVARFAGNLSLDNDGGFVSARAEDAAVAVAADGVVRLRVRGDGRTYRLMLIPMRRGGRVYWSQSFTTTRDTWTDVVLPVDGFRLFSFGQAIAPDRRIDGERSYQVGLMLSDGRPGPFRLEIDWIRATPPPPDDPG